MLRTSDEQCAAGWKKAHVYSSIGILASPNDINYRIPMKNLKLEVPTWRNNFQLEVTFRKLGAHTNNLRLKAQARIPREVWDFWEICRSVCLQQPISQSLGLWANLHLLASAKLPPQAVCGGLHAAAVPPQTVVQASCLHNISSVRAAGLRSFDGVASCVPSLISIF
eukprot:98496-Pelagomonas_calceolata.AAC.2